jgi:hypothetical protein
MLARLAPIIWVLLIVIGNVACQGPLIQIGGLNAKGKAFQPIKPSGATPLRSCQVINRAWFVKAEYPEARASQLSAHSQSNQNSAAGVSGLSSTEQDLWGTNTLKSTLVFDSSQPQQTKQSYQAVLEEIRSIGEQAVEVSGAALS